MSESKRTILMLEILPSRAFCAERGIGVAVGEGEGIAVGEGVIVCDGVLVADWFELLVVETVEFSEVVPGSIEPFDEEQDTMHKQLSKSKRETISYFIFLLNKKPTDLKSRLTSFSIRTTPEERQEIICNASDLSSPIFFNINHLILNTAKA